MSNARFKKIPAYYIVPNGKGQWVSNNELIFYSAKYRTSITIPKGSFNNLASIPVIFRTMLPVNSTHRPAAAIHDYLYFKPNLGLTRKMVDDIFLEAMTVNSHDYFKLLSDNIKPLSYNTNLIENKPLTHPFKAKVMYLAVRLFGWYYFKR